MGKTILLYGILAGVMYGSTSTTVTVTTAPSTLTFNYQSGATTLPKAQTVSVRASSGTPTFTTSTPGTDFWLTVNMNSGILPVSLAVSVNPTGMPVGAYQSSVTITVTGVSTPAVITVNLNVTAPPSTLSVTPATLTFVAPPDPSAPQTLTLTTNESPISYTAAAGATWMTVSPAVGIVFPGQQAILQVTVDATNLVPSATPYTAKITIAASGASVTAKSQNVTVSVTVNSQTPTINSIWPAALPLNGPAQTITIQGTNFYSASVAAVQIGANATVLTTNVVSPTALMAVVPASMLTVAGTLNVIVENPLPGGNSTATALPVISAPTILGIFSAASYATASFSPGELVTIFGTNIGPATAATMNITGAGYVATSLSNVTVTIDGNSAPILYASTDQVTIQIPYECSPGNPGATVLTNGSLQTNATVTLAATAPGIFTADGSGVGQAAAINTSATTGAVTLNSSTNPAKIGDTVSFYLTGEGNYNPTPLSGTTNTGYVIPIGLTPLPQISPTPTVQIGGVDASAGVSYAGVVPGSIIGVLQINVVVPTGSTTGATVPVAISIGGNSTQSNVTINVHP